MTFRLIVPALALCSACSPTPILVLGQRDGGYLDGDAGNVDGGPSLSFGSPEILSAGFTNFQPQDISLTDDELELFFTSFNVYVSRRGTAEEPWGDPVLLADLSSSLVESDPKVSGDGLTMVFTSYRDGGQGDLYLSSRIDRSPTTPWSPPQRVGSLSSSSNDCCISFGATTDIIYLSSNRGGTFDIYRAQRDSATSWTTPAVMTDLSSASDDFAGRYRGDLFLLDSTRNVSSGRDIFAAFSATGAPPYTTLHPVGGVNGPSDDRDAWISVDRRRLYFTSDRNGTFDIFIARR